jgi:hypothetical protein
LRAAAERKRIFAEPERKTGGEMSAGTAIAKHLTIHRYFSLGRSSPNQKNALSGRLVIRRGIDYFQFLLSKGRLLGKSWLRR